MLLSHTQLHTKHKAASSLKTSICAGLDPLSPDENYLIQHLHRFISSLIKVDNLT